jgi:hypothetical protein
VDLGALLGGVREGKIAYLVTSITVERGMEVTLGASADWWMQWRLNGEVICDTLAQGNGGYPYHSFLVHRFVARLKTGRNLLVVKVISGSGGFRELTQMKRHRAGVWDGVQKDTLPQ